MANRSFHPNEGSLDINVVTLQGSFAPNGTSALVASSTLGKGFSVSRTGVGTFLITLADDYPALLAANATLQLHTADDKIVQFGDCDVLSAQTLVIHVWDISAAALADIAANANNRINFSLLLRNSTVK